MILKPCSKQKLQGFFIKILKKSLKDFKKYEQKIGIIINFIQTILIFLKYEMHICIPEMHNYPKLTES